MTIRDVLDALRRPEHTGENRCWPCTAVNVAAVLVVAAVGAVVRPAVGAVVLAGGLAAVALRGYVVPYTPRFAPRLVDPLPVEFKGTSGGRRSDGGRPTGASDALGGDLDAGPGTGEGERLLVALLDAGVLVEDGDLYLAEGFRTDWEAAMADLRTLDDEDLAAAVAGAAPFPGEGRVEFDGVTVEGEERSVWLARPLAIADAAAVRTLADHGVPEDLRGPAATPLRMFLGTCPVCGGAVERTTYRECCGGTRGVYDRPEADVLACTDCGTAVYEFDDGGTSGTSGEADG